MKLFGGYNSKDNELYLNDIKVETIAKNFKTPLYIYDEINIRKTINEFKSNFEENENIITYAGKAFLIPYMCKILKEENIYLDVVSGGELYIAKCSGFPMSNVIFHGNNKGKDEIEMGIKLGVGRFVIDNYRELELINELAKKNNCVVNALIRIAPGIEAHTHEYIKTGMLDTKFGFTIIGKEYLVAIKKCIEYENINFLGIHCHVGSQICDLKPFEDLSYIMVDMAKEIYEMFKYKIKEIDVGGGFAVYYNEDNEPKKISDYCKTILESVKKRCELYNMEIPRLIIEPGRSIIANSGISVYEVGSIKENLRKYVAIDGGMGDNIRPALYKSKYECLLVNNIESEHQEEIRICGKYCESGDVLIDNVKLPIVKEGDLVALLSTGAYGYSMSSNYNMALTPGIVFVNGNEVKEVCKRQTFENLISNFI